MQYKKILILNFSKMIIITKFKNKFKLQVNIKKIKNSIFSAFYSKKSFECLFFKINNKVHQIFNKFKLEINK